MRAEKLLQELEEKRFWGELTLKFQGGRVVHIKKTECFDFFRFPTG